MSFYETSVNILHKIKCLPVHNSNDYIFTQSLHYNYCVIPVDILLYTHGQQQSLPPYHRRERDGLPKKEIKMESIYNPEYFITASNAQGAHCSGGTEKSLTAAIAKARRRFGKGWKIRISVEEKVIKEWCIRK